MSAGGWEVCVWGVLMLLSIHTGPVSKQSVSRLHAAQELTHGGHGGPRSCAQSSQNSEVLA